MARLIATLGASPGVVYEAVLNLCRGSWESPYAAKVSIDEVVVVRTVDPRVEFAVKVLKLLFACADQLPEDKRLPENCRQVKIVDRPVDVQDIDSKDSYLKYYEVMRMHVGQGDFVDVSGGRAAMAVAAARAAMATPYTVVTTTAISSEKFRATTSALDRLRQYNIDQLLEMLKEKTCAEIARNYLDVVKLLAELVTGKAKTVQIAP